MHPIPFKKYLNNYGPFILLLLFILVIWESAVRLHLIPAFILPAPSSIGIALIEHRQLLRPHLLATLQEILVGFVLSVICGSLLGTGMFLFRPLKRPSIRSLLSVRRSR